MNPATFTVTDLVVALVVGLSVLGALRRGRGLLAALASGCLAAVVCWLGAAVVLVAGPASWQHPVADSAFVRGVPAPVRAVGTLIGHVDSRLDGHSQGGGTALAP